MAKSTKRWFAVKSIYRTTASGKPKWKIKGYTDDATLVEERVVLFRAADHDQALTLAAQEAKKYCHPVFDNPFGQKIKTKWLTGLDAFELFETPGDKAEIYSATELVSSAVSDKEVRVAKFGKPEKSPGSSERVKFCNAELLKRLSEV